jgi:hypothetical protein
MTKTGPLIHNRKIDITTYEGGPDSVIVEGILHDERLVETYRPTGDKHPPGAVHHMIIRMEIKGPKLTIEDIEVEMPTIPYEECLETLGTLNQLKGDAYRCRLYSQGKEAGRRPERMLSSVIIIDGNGSCSRPGGLECCDTGTR